MSDFAKDINVPTNDCISRQAAIDTFLTELTKRERKNFLHTWSTVEVKYFVADMLEKLPSAQQWIPCSERLPEEDHWLGGSGRQFSEEVMVTIVNHSDEDTWVDMTQTIDGEWACELPKYCEIVAWMPLPEAWKGEDNG